MFFLLSVGIEMLCAGVLVLAVFALLRVFRIRKYAPGLWWLLSALYFCAVYFVTGLPTVRNLIFMPRLQFIPLITILDDLRNSVLNVFLFMPLGCLISTADPGKKPRQIILCGFFCSLAIEILQIFSGRMTDVNDLFTNTLGAVLGHLAARLLLRSKPQRLRVSKRDLRVSAAVSAGIMFFLQPWLTGLCWRWMFT